MKSFSGVYVTLPPAASAVPFRGDPTPRTVRVSPASGSESFARTSITTAASSSVATVSFLGSGFSFTSITRTVIDALSDNVPSVAVTVTA